MHQSLRLKPVLLAGLLTLSALVASAQTNFFVPMSSAQARLAAPVSLPVVHSAFYQLKTDDLRHYLAKAPLEFQSGNVPLKLTLPLPNGTTETFAMVESPLLSPAVAAAHPDIKTYSGTGLGHATYQLRLSLTSSGFDALILGVENDAVYYTKTSINPTDQVYMTYFARDAQKGSTIKTLGKCGNSTSLLDALPAQAGKRARLGTEPASNLNTGATLRRFRLAIAATKEFTQAKGNGNVTTAFNALVGYVNRLNAVYRRELSVAFTLVSGTSTIFTAARSAGYRNDSTGLMIRRNQVVLDSIIKSENYDIGHLLSFSGDGSGEGLASTPSACDPVDKAQGVSSFGTYPPIFDDHTFTHEVGHQFGMTHSFNSSVPVCTTRKGRTSVEPGAGTTIMSYGYTCGDVGQDNYEATYQPILNFHTVSYDQAATYIATLSCFTAVTTNNAVPVIGTFPASVTIPKSTPFALTGTATDANPGDTLTYSWEGTDTSRVVPDRTTLANTALAPFFRSYAPVLTGTRTFPRLSAILDGSNYAVGDKLPSVGIATGLRMTVRDNVGGVTYQGVTVQVAGNSGPFLETTNLAGSYPGNSSQTITWSVANTTAPPVSCARVNIMLSTDGGLTFPTTLVANTPNDGSEPVTLPAVLTTKARIKVVSSNTVFFDISNSDFSIVAPVTPTVAVNSTDSSATRGPGQSKRNLRLSAGQSGVTAVDTAGSDPGFIRFERSSGQGTLVVQYQIGGTATNGVDYLALPTSVTFADGQTVLLEEMDPLSDNGDQGDETVIITLIDEPEYDPAPGKTTTTLTIHEAQPTPASLTITSFSCTTTGAGLSSVDFMVGYSNGSFIPALPALFINGVTISGQLGTSYRFSGFDGNVNSLTIQDQAKRSTYFTWNFRQACAGAPVTPVPVTPAPASLTITSFTCTTTGAGLSSIDFVVGYSNGSFIPALPAIFINGVTASGQLGTSYRFSGFDGNVNSLAIQDQAKRSTYFTWNFRQACAQSTGRARIASERVENSWQMRIQGNPTGHELTVLISNAQGESLSIDLLTLAGVPLMSRQVQPASNQHTEVIDVSSQPAGLLLLRATSATQRQTLKVVK